jgi:cell division protein FtsQ
MKNINWKKRLEQALWLLIGAGTIVLLGAAIQKKDKKACANVEIEITGAEKDMFIDENDVLNLLNSNGNIIGKEIGKVDLRSLETALEKNRWIKNAEMFFDNNQLLKVRIEEREPVARVFTASDNSFYVDSMALRLPLSDKLSARVPVFTNFPSDKDTLASSDSAMLWSVVKLGKYVLADSFRMAQVSQIDILPDANFEVIPTIGDQIIELGDANDLEKKFSRLNTFYKQAWLQNGMNSYEKLYVQYDNQVVAVKKGVSKILLDSARSKIMMNVVNTGMNSVYDSVKIAVSKPVPVRKDSVTVVKKINNKNVVGIKQNKVSNKSLSSGRSGVAGNIKPKKTKLLKQQPKAVMKKKSNE